MGIHQPNNRVTHFVVGHGPAERLRVNLPNNCTHEVHTMTSLMGEHALKSEESRKKAILKKAMKNPLALLCNGCNVYFAKAVIYCYVGQMMSDTQTDRQTDGPTDSLIIVV